MKFRLAKMLTASALFAAVGAVQALPTVFTFANEFSESGSTCNVNAGTSCATLSVEQVGTGVNFSLTSTLSSGEFIVGLYGNRDPYAGSALSNVSISGIGTGDLPTLSNSGEADTTDTAFKADGDGFFDWRIDFDTAPPAERFGDGDVFSWTFAGTDIDDIIDAISVNGSEGKNGFTFALRVRGLDADNEGSGWFYAVNGGGGDDDEEVPEPATIALVGLALAGLGLSRRRAGRRSV